MLAHAFVIGVEVGLRNLKLELVEITLFNEVLKVQKLLWTLENCCISHLDKPQTRILGGLE